MFRNQKRPNYTDNTIVFDLVWIAAEALMVPETGIEPVRTDQGSTDFKSVVSTNFTTRAKGVFREKTEVSSAYSNKTVELRCFYGT